MGSGLRIVWDSGQSAWRVSGLPYTVLLRVGLRRDGTLICRELQVEADPITSRGIREIPLGEILGSIAFAVSHVLPKKVRSPKLPANFTLAMVGWRGESEDLLNLFQHATPRGPRGSTTTDELVEEIAAAYRRRVGQSDPHPIKFLANRKRWSNGQQYGAANLRRILRIARERGLLGQAPPGKAGEKVTKSGRKPK